MKKIVPFNNVLTFSTDVHEITAISLEHDIKTSPDAISGTFNITGEYKMAEGELKHELIWVDFDDVENKLRYDNLKELWNQVKDKAKEYIEELKS